MTTNKETESVSFTRVGSPVGELTLTWQAGGLTSLRFDDDREALAPPAHWIRDDRRLRAARQQIEAYFAGARATFDLALVLRGTPFQQRVWRALCEIPFGATASYGEIAAAIGAPGASRAVGGANHRNPIAIIIPCHRVIGADGSLTGYGGGEPRKKWLLEHERPQRSFGTMVRPPPAPRPRARRRSGATTSGSIRAS